MDNVDRNFRFERLNENLLKFYRIDPPKHLLKYTPEWSLEFWIYKFLNNLDPLAKFLQKREPEIIDQYTATHDSSTGLGNNTVTSRFHKYNLFHETDPVIEELKADIEKQISTYLSRTDPAVFKSTNFDPHINCWFNIMRPDDKIKEHAHNVTNPFISGHYTVLCEDSYTYYVIPVTRDRLEFKNTIGEGTIFPSYVQHGTSNHTGTDVRISIAWDLYYNKEDIFPAIYDNVEKVNLYYVDPK
jgi:hypothetical protein